MDYRTFSETFLGAMRAGDAATMEAMLDPEFQVVEADGLPYGGTYRGIAGWLDLSRAVIATWAKFRLELIEYAGHSEDSLVIHFAISGISRKTGKPFQSRVLEFWKFRDGRLLRIDPFYFDTQLLAAADSN